jgi:hypothetical protein
MKQNIKATLKKLSAGPRTEKSMTHGDMDLGNTAVHIIRNLNDGQAQGYCVMIGEHWHLTDAGRKALDKKPVSTGKDRICAMSTKEKYDGAELRQLGNRPGAYSFLNVPSLMHFGRVYRKDAI